MKIRITLLCLLAPCLPLIAQNEKCSLNGVLPDQSVDGKTVYLQTVADDRRTLITVDKTTVKKGRFAFRNLPLKGSLLRFITMIEPNRKSLPVFIEPGEVFIRFDSIPAARGTKMNDTYTTFCEKIRSLEEASQDVAPEWEKFIQSIITNDAGVYFWVNYANQINPDTALNLLSLMEENQKNNQAVKATEEQLLALQATQVGNYFTDISGVTPTGQNVALSDYAAKGNFVLVDFWASWCVHCVKEMPALKKLYQKYHDKGFEVIGVSLDTQEAAWKISIERLGLAWVHLSDLDGWEGNVAQSYAVELIPCMVLVDPNGIIVYRGRSGEELEQMLATALDQQ